MIPLRDNVPLRRWPLISRLILVVNLVVFWYQLGLSQAETVAFFHRWGVVPVRLLAGEASEITLLTSTFIHGGWMHLIGNMLYLWVFGPSVEDRMGRISFLLFYLLTGVLAGLAQVYVYPDSAIPLVGASGAIAGILGAYFVCFPRARVLALVPFFFFITLTEIPAIFFLMLWIAVQLFSGIAALGVPSAAGQVAWWAHVGGFFAGMFLIRFFRPPRRV